MTATTDTTTPEGGTTTRPQPTDAPQPASAPQPGDAFDPTAHLAALLAEVGLSPEDAGGSVTFAGEDPIVPARHRLGAGIGIMANAVAAAALHRLRTGQGQDPWD